MNTQTNISKELTGALYQIASFAKQIAYHESAIAPKLAEMEKWEAKEYQIVHESNVAEFNYLRKHIMSNESVFNEMLSKFNMSAAVFIASL